MLSPKFLFFNLNQSLSNLVMERLKGNAFELSGAKCSADPVKDKVDSAFALKD